LILCRYSRTYIEDHRLIIPDMVNWEIIWGILQYWLVAVFIAHSCLLYNVISSIAFVY